MRIEKEKKWKKGIKKFMKKTLKGAKKGMKSASTVASQVVKKSCKVNNCTDPIEALLTQNKIYLHRVKVLNFIYDILNQNLLPQ